MAQGASVTVVIKLVIWVFASNDALLRGQTVPSFSGLIYRFADARQR